jgi:hypothetical protein
MSIHSRLKKPETDPIVSAVTSLSWYFCQRGFLSTPFDQQIARLEIFYLSTKNFVDIYEHPRICSSHGKESRNTQADRR